MLHAIALAVIGGLWLNAWLIGYRWAKVAGVDDSPSLWALACIFPTAALILAVHAMATASMLAGRGWVTPSAVAFVMVLIVIGGRRFVGGLRRPGSLGFAPGPQSERRTDLPSSVRRNSTEDRRGLRIWYLPVAVVVGTYAVFLVDALTGYPTGYDAMHYHLPTAVRWMQEQSMRLLPGAAHSCMPENGMTVPFLLSFAGLETLFTIAHLPKAFLVAVTIYALTRAAGAGLRGSLAAACIALSVPMVVFQSFDGYIDLYAAAMWLTALLAIVWAMRAASARQKRSLLILAGLATGIAVGSKTTYLVMAFMLAMLIAAERWLRVCNNRPPITGTARSIAVFGAAAFACSGFWFVRSTAGTGNPVYPVEVKVNGRVILPGSFRIDDLYPKRTFAEKVNRWWDYPWREPKHSGTGNNPGYPYSRNNALGAAYATFVPLGLIAAAWGGLNGRLRSEEERWRLVFCLIGLCGIALVLSVFQEMLRFALGPILAAIPVGAVLFDRLVGKFPRRTWATFTAGLLVTAAIATLKPAHSFLGRLKDGRWDRAWFYQIPPLIDELENGATIVNLGTATRCYPLLGRNLNNVVISEQQLEALLKGEALSAAALRRLGIDYVYVQGPWPENLPGDLPLMKVYDDTDSRALLTTPASRIYRVVPDEPLERHHAALARRRLAAP